MAAVAFLGSAASASADVSSEGDFAGLDTFQALSAGESAANAIGGSDFFGFSEILNPPVLLGQEGRSSTLASQASALITGESSFPVSSIDGMVSSGRLVFEARKNANALPGVPVASAEGNFEVDFAASSPTPFQLAGAMRALNEDPSDCTEIKVELSGPLSRLFRVRAGADCGQPVARTGGFVVTDRLPAGGYELEVEYGGTVAAAGPGSTRKGSGAYEVSLAFFPPNTKLTRSQIRPGQGKATFKFRSIGGAKRLECALTRGKKAPEFRRCSSPKAYKNLKPGKYTFQARAVGPVAPDATPAKKRFKIPR